MIRSQMVVILVNFLTVTPAKYIHPSAEAVVEAKMRKLSVQPEPDKGRKKTRRALPKWADTDFELGWKEQIHEVQ